MEYLYDKQFYIDRYDLSTIRECRDMVEVCKKAYIKGKNDPIAKRPNGKGELAKATNWMTNQLILQIIAERYRHKEETIGKWILEATTKQNKYDSTEPPENIHCPDCNSLMKVGIKEFDVSDDPLRVMFIFECPSCKKRLWIYEDGQERPSNPTLCGKCKKEAVVTVVKEGKDKIIWKTTCPSCKHVDTSTDDFKKDKLEREKREEEEKNLLESYRNLYCSEKAGTEAIDYIDALPVANEVYKEQLKKYDSQAYVNVTNLKKLTIIELEKILKTLFEKERYSNLTFGQPEIGQHVIVTFTIQDADPTHRSQSCMNDLKNLLKDELESTNWRLMTDSLSNRLGYVSGRLKGYEREEDFFEIAGQKPEVKETKINPEIRSKYEYSNVVQIARITGEFEGKENARKRRLKHDPEGFFLEDDGTHTCGICGENHPSKQTWWTPKVLLCADCWRNIKDGTIPLLGKRHDDDCGYIEEQTFSSDMGYGIHPSTVRKYRRQGLLKGRDLKRVDGSIYCTVYLIKENTEFLKDHPKKERTRMKITDLLGEVVEI
jgi:hypothetical protein